MALSVMLPCRISVYTEAAQPGVTIVSTMLPTRLIQFMPGHDSQTLHEVAESVEKHLVSFIDTAVA
jgi:uncharacterized protein (DUF302 family)